MRGGFVTPLLGEMKEQINYINKSYMVDFGKKNEQNERNTSVDGGNMVFETLENQ